MRGNTKRKIKSKPVEERSYEGKILHFKKEFYDFASKCKTNEEKVDLFLEYMVKNIQLEKDTANSAVSFAILQRNVEPDISSLKDFFDAGAKIKRTDEEQAVFDNLYRQYQIYETSKNNLKEKPNDIWYNKKGSNFFFAMEFKEYCDHFNIPCEVVSGCKSIKYEGELGQMTYVFGHRINKIKYYGKDAYVDIDALLKARDEGKDLQDYRVTTLDAWKEYNKDREVAPDGLSVLDDKGLKYFNWVSDKRRQALKQDVQNYSEKTKARVA